jgi:hypothetical protein
MVIADGRSIPLAIVMASGMLHETNRVGATLEARFIEAKAAASDLGASLQKRSAR